MVVLFSEVTHIAFIHTLTAKANHREESKEWDKGLYYFTGREANDLESKTVYYNHGGCENL